MYLIAAQRQRIDIWNDSSVQPVTTLTSEGSFAPLRNRLQQGWSSLTTSTHLRMGGLCYVQALLTDKIVTVSRNGLGVVGYESGALFQRADGMKAFRESFCYNFERGILAMGWMSGPSYWLTWLP
jgi:hypothetical protein